MPLLGGQKNIGKNIAMEMSMGKPQKQAVAIAMSVSKRKGKKGRPLGKRNKPESMMM